MVRFPVKYRGVTLIVERPDAMDGKESLEIVWDFIDRYLDGGLYVDVTNGDGFFHAHRTGEDNALEGNC